MAQLEATEAHHITSINTSQPDKVQKASTQKPNLHVELPPTPLIVLVLASP